MTTIRLRSVHHFIQNVFDIIDSMKIVAVNASPVTNGIQPTW